MMEESRPLVVIVGAGFGGMNAARALRQAPVDVLILDKNNYHLFQPLLYQVATSGISEDEVAYPVRAIFRKQKNVHFRYTEVTGLDLSGRIVETTTGPVRYDYLILAPGSETNYFGIDSVAENGFTLKELDDAIAIRNHVLRMFELAAQTNDPILCRALRTFVVVGGGPTGVEMAGALSELIRLVLSKDYPDLDMESVQVILLEMMDNVLAGFPEELRKEAAVTLRKKHVEVRLGAAVVGYDGETATLKDGTRIPASTLIWAAGVRGTPFLRESGLELGKGGRVVVDRTMQVPGLPEVFVVGDAAYLEEDGQPLPMVAPVAIQQAKVAARNVERLIHKEPLETFDYRDPGSLATIGRNAAVAHIKKFKFHGFFAWLVWLVVHLFWLIGFRNRLFVIVNWALDYLFFERSVRLITPDGRRETEEHPWPIEEEPVKVPASEGDRSA